MGPVKDADKERYGFAAIYCKTWKCEVCGPKKAARVRWDIAIAAREHKLDRFLTLTLDPKKIDPSMEMAHFLREVWRKFRVYLKRRHGNSLSFISVMEEHKSGIPHLHVLVDRFIPQAWISKAWSALGGGRIVYIERVSDLAGIGWYLGKYLTKEMLRSAKRGQRRYSTSRNIRLGQKRETSGWTSAPAGMSELRRAAGEKAMAVIEDALSGAVQYFETDRPLRRMKAFGGRVMFYTPEDDEEEGTSADDGGSHDDSLAGSDDVVSSEESVLLEEGDNDGSSSE